MDSMVAKDSQKKSKARKRGEFFFGTKRPYLLAIVAAIILFMLVAPVRVHGGNMAPLLNDGDVVIIAKSTYYDEKLPGYGDILCFKRSFAQASASADGVDNVDGRDGAGGGDSERYYRFAKVYGLPGDEMSVMDGELLRNGVKVCDLNAGSQSGSGTDSGGNVDVKSSADSLIAGRKIGLGEVFVLNYYTADNMDSRNSNVDARLDDVRGKILFRIFPINMFGAVE